MQWMTSVATDIIARLCKAFIKGKQRSVMGRWMKRNEETYDSICQIIEEKLYKTTSVVIIIPIIIAIASACLVNFFRWKYQGKSWQRGDGKNSYTGSVVEMVIIATYHNIYRVSSFHSRNIIGL